MELALEDVAFLARSPNRVRVLEELSIGARTRNDLERSTDASRVTLGRILSAFEERGWIVRQNRGYRMTPFGDLVLADFDELRKSVETARRFRGVARHLPADELDFDLRRLADADLVTATAADPLAVAREAARRMRDAADVRILAHAVTGDVLSNQREAAIERGQRSDVVLSTETYDAIAGDPEMRAAFADLLGSDRFEAHRYDGEIPFTIGIYDGQTVTIAFVDENAFPSAAAFSDDEAILEWADRCVDGYREDAERITLDTFPS